MPRSLIDISEIDDALLAEAARVFGTFTARDTVTEALRRVVDEACKSRSASCDAVAPE
jgi:Arc/MetJ family transcription regulator